jgi:hypothetical protein
LWVCTSLIYIGSTYYIQYHTGFELAMKDGVVPVDETAGKDWVKDESDAESDNELPRLSLDSEDGVE